jgi:hypothetical protein
MTVTLFNQKGAWMDLSISKTWFVLQMQEHFKSRDLPEKAVLLLDNASLHLKDSVQNQTMLKSV